MPREKSLKNLKSFQPGQSGNPKGRAPGTKTIKKALTDILNKNIEFDSVIAEFSGKMSVQEAIALKLIEKAITGDVRAISEVFDRSEGKAAQEIKLQGDIEVKKRMSKESVLNRIKEISGEPDKTNKPRRGRPKKKPD